MNNLISKEIFARWQDLFNFFEFQIEFIKEKNNSLPNFLTREFLQENNETQNNKKRRLRPPF